MCAASTMIASILARSGSSWVVIAPGAYDAVLVRCLSHTNAYYITRWLEGLGVPIGQPAPDDLASAATSC